ncbi:DUF4170 domain-containing protein [Haematospirillum sp. H1815]|uniref:DUF4170 domain-containing protein n=1 Tax=Haematospirillum sp. H1815 TaxID=2723108 RepID=UPI00143B60F9|nr:DUF4170 domain-containing protein [Haematospirillum sp. H1815]NKD76475.1 DUF4170 domain-containing protein [Haematospirillum sp. H1815]
MSEKRFYVIGGEYSDSAFSTIAAGKSLEKYGPYTEVDAHAFWRDITGRTVDNAMVRYVVEENHSQLDDKSYYVVGGEYADTTFATIASGHSLEVYGPFTQQQAQDFWRTITSQTIDSCLHRYDISHEDPRR